MKAQINRVTVELVQADVLSQAVAAAVIQTDTDLRLPRELEARAGLGTLRQIAAIGSAEVGSAAMVDGGGLGVPKLLLAVGPRWGEGSERGKLGSIVFDCLQQAEEAGLDSIAFPALSTGALGYPIENCATTMLSQIVDYTFEDLNALRGVVICLRDPLALEAFEQALLSQVDELRQTGEGEIEFIPD